MRRIRASWRRLTGGRAAHDPDRPTLIACSGGADSSALVLALCRIGRPQRAGAPSPRTKKPKTHITVAHIVHDLRPESDALSDRDAVRHLCAQLRLPFVESRINTAKGPGNAEHNARIARYEALDELAAQNNCRFVATAHHADDQLETMLMRLIRGSAPGGLAGIAPSRPLATTTLVRPMLSVARDNAERLCTDAGWTWRTDTTNTDESHLRAALRARVLPHLRDLAGNLGPRLERTAELLDNAQQLAAVRACELLSQAHTAADAVSIARATLHAELPLIIGAYLRSACAQIAGPEHTDARTAKALYPIIDAIRDDSTDPRRWSLAGITVRVDAHKVVVTRVT